jgi:hypothetical protein
VRRPPIRRDSMLHFWLLRYKGAFGWRPLFSANDGAVTCLSQSSRGPGGRRMETVRRIAFGCHSAVQNRPPGEGYWVDETSSWGLRARRFG